MFFSRIGLPENIATTVFQLAVALTLLIFGAKGFINGVEDVSALLGISYRCSSFPSPPSYRRR